MVQKIREKEKKENRHSGARANERRVPGWHDIIEARAIRRTPGGGRGRPGTGPISGRKRARKPRRVRLACR